jgi:hypothetical protein
LGLPVPDLQEVAPDNSWFREAYITGTPLNRLPDATQLNRAAAQAFEALQKLWQATAEEVDTVQYASQLAERVQQTASTITLLTDADRNGLRRTCKQLQQRIERLATEQPYLRTVLTHGDCQPANILVNGQDIWLIDWEYADRRIAGYDELVFGLQARSPAGLSERLEGWVKDGTLAGLQTAASKGDKYTDNTRELVAAIFLLEELALHMTESANPLFTRLGPTLATIQQEANAWLNVPEGAAS